MDKTKNPALIRAFTGVPAVEFWDMIEKMEAKLPDYEIGKHTQEDRKRAMGAGRKFDQSLAQRTVSVLSYLRLHIPQLVIGLMFGLTQCDISRDLRRLRLINSVLPSPEVWDIQKDNQESKELVTLPAEQLANDCVLVDATEQHVYRPGKSNETRKLYYSGKKKIFTIKTQMLTDDDYHILAISVSVPGAMHDKKLSDEVKTLERLPDGCEVDADKGYQGMASQVSLVTVCNPETGIEQQEEFNSQLSAIRVRVEHCIGWVKNWAIVATRFRCSHLIYTSVMQTVCGLVNVQTRRWQTANRC